MKKIIPFLSCLFLAACAGDMEMRLDQVRNAYTNTNYVAGAQEFSGQSEIPDQNNLELLISADALFHANEYKASDDAYEEFNHRNIDLTGTDLGREAGALIAGNLANDYRPLMMDALFVSYYQIWDALADGRPKDARVVINQSYERQKNMSVEYAKLVEENQASASDNQELITNLRNENSQWKAFTGIMNPALTYLSGIYFLNNGDFGDAKTYLKRSEGMMPDNGFIDIDLALAKQNLIPSGVVWVFIETGFAPKLTEQRMDIPWLIGGSMGVVSIAVSEPVFFNEETKVSSSQLLTDVDSLFMTEYKEYRINEAIRAWTDAVARAALQATLSSSDSEYAGLLGLMATGFSIATTNAEVRTWASLPKKIYLLRVQKNKSGFIELKSGGCSIAKVNVPASGNHLIYARLGGINNDIKVIKIK